LPLNAGSERTIRCETVPDPAFLGRAKIERLSCRCDRASCRCDRARRRHRVGWGLR